MTATTPPIAPDWANLLEAIALLARHPSSYICPFHCEHDVLTVMANPEAFTVDEIARLETIGFHPGDEATFYSYRYGSA